MGMTLYATYPKGLYISSLETEVVVVVVVNLISNRTNKSKHYNNINQWTQKLTTWIIMTALVIDIYKVEHRLSWLPPTKL